MHNSDASKVITMDPNKRNGKPCIRGLRISVYDVLGYLASGMTQQQLLDDFPDLTSNDIRACFAFAADRDFRMVEPDDHAANGAPPTASPAPVK